MNSNFQAASWNTCLSPEKVATLDCVPIILQNLITFLIGFAGVVSVLLIVWAGIRFVMSEGDKEKIVNARKTLTYALVGLLLVALAFVIVTFFVNFAEGTTFFIK